MVVLAVVLLPTRLEITGGWGAETVTVAVAVTLPDELVAVRV